MSSIIKPFIFISVFLLTALGFGLMYNIVHLVDNVAAAPTEAAAAFAAITPVRVSSESDIEELSEQEGQIYTDDIEGTYELYIEDNFVNRFDSIEDAITFASSFQKCSIRETGKTRWIWDNYPAYCVFTDLESFVEFYDFAQAVAFAKKQEQASIFYRKNKSLIWSNANPLSGHASIDAPYIPQLPELPRGCEVTSLAMLLGSKDIHADKMTLASAVKKDNTHYETKNRNIYYGNPNDGFVGDMYSYDGPGLGVYHDPIHTLLLEYLPDSALDITGCDFEDIFYFLEAGAPVWVIINTTYSPLPASAFTTWHTPTGKIQITYKEHSVLVTGYDSKRIYYNDPLSGKSSAGRAGFIGAWEQMGRQAVTYTP